MLYSWRNLHSVSRSAHDFLKMARNFAQHGPMKCGKPNWHSHPPCANHFFRAFSSSLSEQFASSKGIDGAEIRNGTNNVLVGHPADNVTSAFIFKNSSHRDGSIYRHSFLQTICPISNRHETQLEPMMFLEPTNCFPARDNSCGRHVVCSMMQVFSLKLAKVHMDTTSVQLYGYIAARDNVDGLLNYIFNCSRDNSIMAQQGSLIEMTGPKRGIAMSSPVLVEFDMKIKKGQREKDDLQLIDGATEYGNLSTGSRPFTERITGDYGAVDITLARVPYAVEATIDVVISKVKSGFSLSVGSSVFAGGSHQSIQLFCGFIGESCGLRRNVIAVEIGTRMFLKFKVGRKGSKYDDLERCCYFKANIHGCASRQIVLEHASISVKVTWSTLP